MRQNVLIGITVIVLISNVFLGYELYTTVHPQQTSAITPIYLNGTSVLNQTKIITITNGTGFSYEYRISLTFPKEGVYDLGINPHGFESLYVLIYQDDGNTVSLSLNNTKAQFIVDDLKIPVTVYVSGVFNQTPSSQSVFDSLGLYYQYVGPINVIGNVSGSIGDQHENSTGQISNTSDSHDSTDNISSAYNMTVNSNQDNKTQSSEQTNSTNPQDNSNSTRDSGSSNSSGGSQDSG
ncbi:hypothetical protein, partial [Metallosphaera hakonensis]